MMAEPIQLLEIERELSGPDSEAVMRRHDAVLASLDVRLGNALAAGLVPDEFERAGKLREAVVLARKLIRLTVRKGV